jgi:hypothetical protein
LSTAATTPFGDKREGPEGEARGLAGRPSEHRSWGDPATGVEGGEGTPAETIARRPRTEKEDSEEDDDDDDEDDDDEDDEGRRGELKRQTDGAN